MSTATRLQSYLDAEAAILRGQSVRMGDRNLERADLAEVRKAITSLQMQLAAETAAATGRPRAFGGALADFRRYGCDSDR